MVSNMQELIERLERATGFDSSLNDDIALQAGYRIAGAYQARPHTYFAPDGSYIGIAPSFTGSIDAAMTLVPEGVWSITSTGSAWIDTTNGKGTGLIGTWFNGKAKTPATALCIAALKARSALSASDQGEVG